MTQNWSQTPMMICELHMTDKKTIISTYENYKNHYSFNCNF